jgi:GNAT superfamily N-acetyltransferase
VSSEADGVRFSEVDAESPAARQAVGRYFAELAERFDGGFDVSAYRGAGAVAGAGVFVIATVAGRPVGCGALQALAPDVAEIKRMWVDPGSRGLGLGRRLLADLERRAARRGWSTVRLDTNAALTEAIALYERSGYRTIPRYNDNPYASVWFEKSLSTSPRHSRTDV